MSRGRLKRRPLAALLALGDGDGDGGGGRRLGAAPDARDVCQGRLAWEWRKEEMQGLWDVSTVKSKQGLTRDRLGRGGARRRGEPGRWEVAAA